MKNKYKKDFINDKEEVSLDNSNDTSIGSHSIFSWLIWPVLSSLIQVLFRRE
jgi:hypothetical protein